MGKINIYFYETEDGKCPVEECKEEFEMSRYADFKRKSLENSEIRAAYDELQPEYDIIQAMIDARKSKKMTQKDLSEITGITQADISRIENGTRNPSLAMVKRLAAGMGMQLRLEFIPGEKVQL